MSPRTCLNCLGNIFMILSLTFFTISYALWKHGFINVIWHKVPAIPAPIVPEEEESSFWAYLRWPPSPTLAPRPSAPRLSTDYPTLYLLAQCVDYVADHLFALVDVLVTAVCYFCRRSNDTFWENVESRSSPYARYDAGIISSGALAVLVLVCGAVILLYISEWLQANKTRNANLGTKLQRVASDTLVAHKSTAIAQRRPQTIAPNLDTLGDAQRQLQRVASEAARGRDTKQNKTGNALANLGVQRVEPDTLAAHKSAAIAQRGPQNIPPSLAPHTPTPQGRDAPHRPRVPAKRTIFTVLAVLFTLSLPWEFMRLYQAEVAKKTAVTIKGTPPECLHQPPLWPALCAWLRRQLSWATDPCVRYQTAVIGGPLWEVTPLLVLSSLVSRCVAAPVQTCCAVIGSCFRLLLQDVPAQWQPVVVATVAVVWGGAVLVWRGYGVTVPWVLSLGPTRVNATPHGDNATLNTESALTNNTKAATNRDQNSVNHAPSTRTLPAVDSDVRIKRTPHGRPCYQDVADLSQASTYSEWDF